MLRQNVPLHFSRKWRYVCVDSHIPHVNPPGTCNHACRLVLGIYWICTYVPPYRKMLSWWTPKKTYIDFLASPDGFYWPIFCSDFFFICHFLFFALCVCHPKDECTFCWALRYPMYMRIAESLWGPRYAMYVHTEESHPNWSIKCWLGWSERMYKGVFWFFQKCLYIILVASRQPDILFTSRGVLGWGLWKICRKLFFSDPLISAECTFLLGMNN